jgi:hypothetical protein
MQFVALAAAWAGMGWLTGGWGIRDILLDYWVLEIIRR